MRVSRLQNLEEKMSDRQFPWVIWRRFFILYPKKTSEITGKLPEMIVWLPNAKYVSLPGNVAKFEQIFGPKFDSLVLEFFRFFFIANPHGFALMEFCVNLYANRFADSRPTSDPESNYNTCNRMFDMCSSYFESFIYISLSIAMWHGIFENWRIPKMPFQRKRSIP